MPIVLMLSLVLSCTLFSSVGFAQKNDTLLVDPSVLKTQYLKPGTSRYLVYFKMKPDAPRSYLQIWNRTISRSTYNGNEVFTINQVWEDKDSIVHTALSHSDARTFQTLYHQSWWAKRGEAVYDFDKQTASVNTYSLSDADTALQMKTLWQSFKSAWGQYSLNWHADLEVFSLLPYREGVTFLIPFYESGYDQPRPIPYTVTGKADLTGYNNQKIACWLLTHETKGNKEVFWVSQQTQEVLKLEQVLNGTRYRYKIKLGFSE
ncbi:hypothetical protein KJS94_14725 [Flavihumibacter rivuli]|uniref:DUF3108 domain-containing protein n=1 Tax=Flavihumibacter rivuli TaxID=2838156 RepID=UPI001BDE69F9|nr:hypothetical protein [Flavihumibacter rivuli]ULQ55902.1 hypothetical protein KJS94_14725 [Flavihumibacter rivuli]